MICTFMVDFSAAHLIAASASARGNVLVTYFSTRRGGSSRISKFDFSFPIANKSNATLIGPQRDPITRNSSITKGAALNCSPAAHVDLRTYKVKYKIRQRMLNFKGI